MDGCLLLLRALSYFTKFLYDSDQYTVLTETRKLKPIAVFVT